MRFALIVIVTSICIMLSCCTVAGSLIGAKADQNSYTEIENNKTSLLQLKNGSKLRITLIDSSKHTGTFIYISDNNIQMDSSGNGSDNENWAITLQHKNDSLELNSINIVRIEKHKKTYVPILGLLTGLGIDYYIFSGLKENFTIGPGQ